VGYPTGGIAVFNQMAPNGSIIRKEIGLHSSFTLCYRLQAVTNSSVVKGWFLINGPAMDASDSHSTDGIRLPALREIAADLTRFSAVRLVWSLLLPFVWIALYVVFASLGYWVLAVACLVCLSFVTYGSISHDLVHANLGLPRAANELFLTVIELAAIRSGHAYRMAHLHHHAIFPHDDDIEGAAARMSLMRTLIEGLLFQPKIWWWAMRQQHKDRAMIFAEGVGCAAIIAGAIALWPVIPSALMYVALMIMGSWIIPLVTSYVPHNADGETELLQTRLFRGRVASIIAVEHLYHLEHHLYPAVPHHHWPTLARRLDPFFARAGIRPLKLWF
jgi:beta-carotene hydroxylase